MAIVGKAPVIAPFQLSLEASEARYHTLNDGGEINRSNITDDATSGFTIMVSLEKAIHGEDTNLHSFIGFHIILCGANHKRRFKAATITIRFEDEEKPLQNDPEVVNIWPETEYIWRGMTKNIHETRSLGGTVGGETYGVPASLEGKWERQENFERNTPARISGEKTLLERRAGSHKNAMRIRMWENPQEKSGVLRELRAGILIRRKRAGPFRFKAHIEIKAEADMRYDVVQGLKKLVGVQHVTHPVLFEPGINYLDANDVAGINGDIPGPDMVKAYGEAASCVELVNLTRRMRREEGAWREVVENGTQPTSA